MKEYYRLLDLAFPDPPKNTPKLAKNILSNYNSKIVPFIENGELKAGLILVKIKEGLYGIEFIAVDPRFQRKGIGKRLLKRVFKSHDGVFICTTKRSVRFYYRCGFKLITYEKGRYYLWYSNNLDGWLL